jgi:hypothetical protein
MLAALPDLPVESDRSKTTSNCVTNVFLQIPSPVHVSAYYVYSFKYIFYGLFYRSVSNSDSTVSSGEPLKRVWKEGVESKFQVQPRDFPINMRMPRKTSERTDHLQTGIWVRDFPDRKEECYSLICDFRFFGLNILEIKYFTLAV